MVATDNPGKVAALRAAVARQMAVQCPAARLRVLQRPAASGVPAQPLDGEGMRGASERLGASMRWLGSATGQRAVARHAACTVVINSIESYIDRRPPAADFGVVMLCNVTRGHLAWQISAGVAVPEGLDAAAAARTGVTVGALLAAERPGICAADWHRDVCGHSRYALLAAAAATLDVAP